LGIYDDARSDDKSVEPESVVVTKMGDKTILFVGLEKLMRLWCMMFRILLLQNFTDFKTGDAPEGLLLFQLRKVLPKFDGGEQ
jgi:hypothetical protein